MLPLLEWFAFKWDVLLHESRLPVRNLAADAWTTMAATAFPPESSLSLQKEEEWRGKWKRWWDDHCILAARSGGLFPSVFFRRWQDLIEVSWGTAPVAGQPSHYRFLASKGFERLPAGEVAQALFDVLEDAVVHLRKALPDSERIERLHNAVSKIPTVAKSQRMAILSGLDKDRWDSLEEAIRGRCPEAAFESVFAGEGTDLVVTTPGSAALMFGSASPTLEDSDVHELALQLAGMYSATTSNHPLERFARSEPLDSSQARPWEQGYALADELLDELELLKDANWIDVESLCLKLGITIRSIHLKDKEIRAVAATSKNHTPAIFINVHHPTSSKPSGRRFTIAHELCHLLHDRLYGARLALASGPWAPKDLEKRANSFAAEFLMPSTLVQAAVSKLSVPLATIEGIQTVAKALKTSFTATAEHLANIGSISEAELESLHTQHD
jgi:Zn-dependent peptidase ImmA (M78 family)